MHFTNGDDTAFFVNYVLMRLSLQIYPLSLVDSLPNTEDTENSMDIE